MKISKTHLKTRWVKSQMHEGFITCENCKQNQYKYAMAYKKSYVKFYNFCPICGASFKHKRKLKRGQS